VVKVTMGLRVSKTEEMEGLDIGEHGEVAYIIPSTGAPKLEQVAS
jgi:ammonia channel protein AmtB